MDLRPQVEKPLQYGIKRHRLTHSTVDTPTATWMKVTAEI